MFIFLFLFDTDRCVYRSYHIHSLPAVFLYENHAYDIQICNISVYCCLYEKFVENHFRSESKKKHLDLNRIYDECKCCNPIRSHDIIANNRPPVFYLSFYPNEYKCFVICSYSMHMIQMYIKQYFYRKFHCLIAPSPNLQHNFTLPDILNQIESRKKLIN